jgi:5-methyltetrahydrofolate--homocysteine methyltransferase
MKYQEAQENKYRVDWSQHQPSKPNLIGKILLTDFYLDELLPFIDWNPFFKSWCLPGRYPKLLKDEKVGQEANRIYQEAQVLIDDIKTQDLIELKAVLGFYPSNSEGEDILIYVNDYRNNILKRLPMLRQQTGKPPYFSLRDYIAPTHTGIKDYLGFFTVSAGFGVRELVQKYKKEGDVYKSLMLRLVVDRLTEAFAELLHLRVRKNYWGYEPQENLNLQELIQEKYVGIRPAPGYPSCPDHLLKADIFDILDVENLIGVSLTENYVMDPVSSICGFYFAYKEAQYFKVDIKEDQLKTYADKRDLDPEVAQDLFQNIVNKNTDSNYNG